METRKKGFSLRRFIAFLMTFAMLLSIVPSDLKVRAASGESYPITINFFDYDGETAYAPTSEDIPENDYFVVVGLLDTEGAVQGYGIWDIGSIAGAQTITGSVDKFYDMSKRDSYYVDFNDPYNCPGEFTESISGYTPYVRLVHGNKMLGYDQIMAQCKQTIDGFAFMSSTNHGQTASVMNIQKAEEKKFNVHFINNGSDLDLSGSKYYLAVELGHNNSPSTYYLSEINSIPGGESVISISNADWRTQNNQPIDEKDNYSGHENFVNVSIVKATGDSLEFLDYLNNPARSVKISEGGMVKGSTVSYDDGKYEYDISNDYFDITLTPSPVEHDYSYDELLGDAVNYGIVGKTMSHLGHSQTNIAAVEFTADNSNVLESNLAGNPPASAPGNFIIERFGDDTSKLNIGEFTYSTADIYIPDYDSRLDDRSGFAVKGQGSAPSVQGMIDSVMKKSADMANHAPNYVVDAATPEGFVYIDTTGMASDATIYIDVNGTDDPIYKALEAGKHLYIKTEPDQLIVFNFKNVQSIDIKEIYVDCGDTEYGGGYYSTVTFWREPDRVENRQADLAARHVVFNLTGVKETTMHDAGGIFISPDTDSTIHGQGASCGWIVGANRVLVGDAGEFHFVYGGMAGKNYANLQIIKVDADTNRKLDGAVFELYQGPAGGGDDPLVKVGEATTDINGKAVFEEIGSGRDYFVKEVAAPDGYVITDSDYHKVELVKKSSEDGSNIVEIEDITIKDESNALVIHKVDETGAELAGATLQLTGPDLNMVASLDPAAGPNGPKQRPGSITWITRADKPLTIRGLHNGTYTLQETKAPSLEYALADPITFTVENGVITSSSASVDTTKNPVEIKMVDKKQEVPTGSLSVTKVVDTSYCDAIDETFFVKVTLKDAENKTYVLDGAYGDMTFSGGVANLQLKAGDTLTATDLPEGVKYEVKEDESADSYHKFDAEGSSNLTGTISSTSASEAVVRNVRKLTDAKLTKTLANANDGDADLEFTFTITILNDKSVHGTLGDVTFNNGVATVKIIPSQKDSVSFQIPMGCTYEITETPVDGFEVSSQNASGTAGSKAINASFTNKRPEVGAVKATKTVTGDTTDPSYDANETYLVSVSLKAPEGKNLDAIEVKPATYTKEVILGRTFIKAKLKADESIEITNIPADTEYAVVEDIDVLSDGYEFASVTYPGDTHKVVNRAVQEVKVNNTYSSPVGSLIVSKTISGTELNKLETISFEVTGDKGTVVTVPDLTTANVENGTWTDAGNGKYTYTVENLPAGEKFKVKETLDGHTKDYVLDSDNSTTENESAAIVANDTERVSSNSCK